jgi:NAD(P)-dependent dehydrogenase (short-subunit alcohol dehydrogenase family)
MRLKDKVAIVTGGGKGIGRAISLALASEGANVVVAGRSLPSLEEVVKDIQNKGGRAKAIQADVRDETQVKQLVKQTLAACGPIDVLVNNAGIAGPTAALADLTLHDWNEVLATNLTGFMLCAREVLASMIPRRSGSIINIGSISGMAGHPLRSPYAVSKWGINGLTETLSIEVGQYNIRVNCVSPGAVKGERMNKVWNAKAQALHVTYEEVMNSVVSQYSLKRIAEPTEVAAAVVFLAADDSSGITGHTLVVNCGYHINF